MGYIGKPLVFGEFSSIKDVLRYSGSILFTYVRRSFISSCNKITGNLCSVLALNRFVKYGQYKIRILFDQNLFSVI